MPCTAPDVRTIIPTNTDTQLRHRANSTASRQPASALSGSVWIRKPIRYADAERRDGDDHVAHDVAEHRADQRRRPRDRQRPEPVEDALLDVGVEVDADRDRAHRDGLRQDARQQELQVVVRVEPATAPPKM